MDWWLLLIPYAVAAFAVTMHHEGEYGYPMGRSLARGLLWPIILVRLLVVESWRIVRGA